jgi:hypothetical protein
MFSLCSTGEDHLNLVVLTVRELPDAWQRAFALDLR